MGIDTKSEFRILVIDSPDYEPMCSYDPNGPPFNPTLTVNVATANDPKLMEELLGASARQWPGEAELIRMRQESDARHEAFCDEWKKTKGVGA